MFREFLFSSFSCPRMCSFLVSFGMRTHDRLILDATLGSPTFFSSELRVGLGCIMPDTMRVTPVFPCPSVGCASRRPLGITSFPVGPRYDSQWVFAHEHVSGVLPGLRQKRGKLPEPEVRDGRAHERGKWTWMFKRHGAWRVRWRATIALVRSKPFFISRCTHPQNKYSWDIQCPLGGMQPRVLTQRWCRCSMHPSPGGEQSQVREDEEGLSGIILPFGGHHSGLS